VDNLLDSSRLATGAVEPNIRPVGYDEIVARALSSLDGRDGVAVDVDEHLPAVRADPGLLERVVANVIDNALRHGHLTPRRQVDLDGNGVITADEPIVAVRASAYADQVELRIVDHGRGLPKAPRTRCRSLRSSASATATPLQASVSACRWRKGSPQACGTIRAEDTPGGGLTVVISLRADGVPDQ